MIFSGEFVIIRLLESDPFLDMSRVFDWWQDFGTILEKERQQSILPNYVGKPIFRVTSFYYGWLIFACIVSIVGKREHFTAKVS